MLDKTPRGERTHIAIIGKRNAGKSSLINAITGQETAIVSHMKGTTTDPVYKAMELLPLGPVVFIDTPGIDDEGILGTLRIDKTMEVLGKTDIALFVTTTFYLDEIEKDTLKMIEQKHIPYIVVYNKSDQYAGDNLENDLKVLSNSLNVKVINVSVSDNYGIHTLKEDIAKIIPDNNNKRIISDLITENDLVVLVVPIDESAPKGRLILPQQQTIRDILDANAFTVITKETEYPEALRKLNCKPKIVITDSQVFGYVNANTDSDIYLTSFSILFARYKGDLNELIKGSEAVSKLNDGDKILIAEGCTHHRQCNDIGTVKIPRMLAAKTGKNFSIETSSGSSFSGDLCKYSLIIHCGGCTLNNREMQSRIEQAKAQNVPIVNYGVFIAYVNGILERSIEIFNQ